MASTGSAPWVAEISQSALARHYVDEATSSRRRRRSTSGSRGGGRARREPSVEAVETEEQGLQMVVAGAVLPRASYPRGPSLRSDFAVGWDGSNLLLSPTSHLSYRARRGYVSSFLLPLDFYSGFGISVLCFLTNFELVRYFAASWSDEDIFWVLDRF